MTADEFLAWARTRAEGRFELHNGSVVAMAPERAEHVEVKFNVTTGLRAAIARAGLPCFAYVDGLAVRIDAATTFEPDALVVCGDKVPADSIVAEHPVVVVEVLSPSTGYSDLGPKVEGYFKVASIEHYLIVDPATRRVIHHRRLPGGSLETRLVSAGLIHFEPPGFELAIEAVFFGL